MDLVESFYLAWRAIRSHRLRSALTTLGVVIGVAAVILFVTLGASLQAAIVQEIEGEQGPSVTVTVAPQDAGFQAILQGGSPVFTEADVERIRAIPGVTAVHPHDPIITGRSATQTIIYTDTFPLTSPVLRALFMPINRTIRFDSREVDIQLPTNGSIPAMVSGRINLTSSDGRVHATVIAHISPTSTQPLSTDQQQRYSRLTIEAASYQQLPEVRRRTKQFLQTESDARRFMPESYEFVTISSEEIVEQVNDIVGTLTSYIVAVALLSWLVGSIGIVNIMLVSVTERTQSIGIMKAVGAQKRDILQVFLVEAIVLGIAGAVLGILVGGFSGVIATWLLDLPLVFRLQWVGFAVLSGIVVGAIAGVYPAWRAARTDPIEALRYG
jgi:putative ABC transport system permease protein